MISFKKIFGSLCVLHSLTSPIYGTDEVGAIEGFVGTIPSSGNGPNNIVFSGTFGLVVNQLGTQIGLFDVSTPGTSSYVGATIAGGNSPRGMAIRGTTGYVPNASSDNIGIIDLSAVFPPIPNWKGTVYSQGVFPVFIAVQGTTAYVVNRSTANITLFDLTIPGTMTFWQTVDTGGIDPSMIGISGTTGYVVNEATSNIGIIDLNSNPPVLKGSVSSGGIQPKMILINGSTGYVPNQANDKIGILDLSVPGTATLVSTIDSGGYGQFMVLNGTNTAYIANYGANNIGVLSLSPQAATLIGTISSGGIAPTMIAISGTTAFVSNYYSPNLGVLDVTLPQSPKLLGTIPSGGNGPSFIAINGTTGFVTNFDSASVGIFNTQVVVIPTPPTPPAPTLLPVEIAGPGGRTAAQLNKMSQTGDLSSDNLAFLNRLLGLQGQPQITAITDSGSQHKVLQYQIEKLDLLLHKELEHELYSSRSGTQGFLLGGYDNFSQKSVNAYPGYNVDHYYQMLGLTHDFGRMKWLLALAGSESYEKLKPRLYSAKASYYTAWGTIGVSSHHKRWSYGLDALFGYSFINARRTIQYLDLKARTNHGMWNVSLDGKLGYSFTVGKAKLTPYENLGYLYGHENDYKEHGAPGANLSIFEENISVLRNQLGIKLVSPIDKTKLNVFIDGAWVYEAFFGNKNYKQQFIGSSIVASVTQTVPTRNYGRINAGLQGIYKDFNWRIAYTGLYGSKLADSAASLDLGYKF